MKITKVEAFAVKVDHHYKVSGRTHQPEGFPNSPYYLEPGRRQIYATQLMTCLIKVTTDAGLVGWGESQTPIAPEVVGTIIRELVGPALLGRDPLAHLDNYERLYRLLDVRGHREGFMLDAIAGVDIALWDVKGQASNVPIAVLLGATLPKRVPLYVSGLRRPTLEEQLEAASEYIAQGYRGIKQFFLGQPDVAAERAARIRESIGPESRLMVDLLWGSDLAGARRLAARLEELQVDFLEAPLPVEALDDHVQLVASARIPIAIGENLRTVFGFRPWIDARAAQVLQPDIARTGVTAGLQIAALATAYGRDITWHVGTCSPVAMAASWHMAAATPTRFLQEHQAELYPAVARFVKTPLVIERGEAIVPEGAGLGITVDEDAVRSHGQAYEVSL